MKKEMICKNCGWFFIFFLIVFSLQGCAGYISNRSQKVMEDWKNHREAYITAHPNIDARTKQAVLNGKLFIGMERSAVIGSYKEPYKINRTETASGIHEQWIYGYSNPIDFSVTYTGLILYIDNGKLTAIQN